MRYFLLVLIFAVAGYGKDPAAKPNAWTIAVLPVTWDFEEKSEARVDMVNGALDARFLELKGVVLVDRKRISQIKEEYEIALHDESKVDLKVGWMIGAEALIQSNLSKDKKGYRLEMTAVETVSGNPLLRRSYPITTAEKTMDAVGAFVKELPAKLVRKDDLVDLAVLKIEYSGPFSSSTGLSDVLHDRLVKRLGAAKGVRVLHRDLGSFIFSEASLASSGLVNAKSQFLPKASIVAIDGKVTETVVSGKPMEEAKLKLDLTVRYGKSQKTLSSEGTRKTLATIEADLNRQVFDTVKAWTKSSVTTLAKAADKDVRYWEAQIYLEKAKKLVSELRGKDFQDLDHRPALDMATKAANLYPNDLEFLDPLVHLALIHEYSYKGAKLKGGVVNDSHPVVRLRQRLIKRFKGEDFWLPLVHFELNYQTEYKYPLAKDEFERVKGLVYEAVPYFVEGGAAGWFSYTARVPLAVLMQNGDFDAAWKVAHSQSLNHGLCGWTFIRMYVSLAIRYKNLDAAFKAAQYQTKHWPGYEVELAHECIEILKKEGNYKRWEPVFTPVDEWEERGRNFEKLYRSLPDGLPDFVKATPFEGGKTVQVPQGSIMAISCEGSEMPWTLVRSGTTYYVWKIGQTDAVKLEDFPYLIPEGQISGYEMRPSLAFFGGNLFVGTEKHGLRVINVKTGASIVGGNGFPSNAEVHDLWVYDGKLYAAGKGTGAGFIASLAAKDDKWIVWLAPKEYGGVRRVCHSEKGSWLVCHNTKAYNLPLSNFDPATGKWRKLGYHYDYARSDADVAQSFKGWVFEFNTFHSRIGTMRRHDLASEKSQTVRFPPDYLSEFSHILRRHEPFWDEKERTSMMVVPLTSCANDALVVDDRLLVLDDRGCLISTKDWKTFSNPIDLVDSGFDLCFDGNSLYVSSGTVLKVIPWKAVKAALDKATEHDPGELSAKTLETMKKWLATQDPLRQACYYGQIQQKKRAMEAYRKAGLTKNAESAAFLADELNDNGKYELALEVLEPFVKEPDLLTNKSLEEAYLDALEGAEKWEEIKKVVPWLWKNSKLRGRHVPNGNRDDAWFNMVYNTRSKKEYEEVLWARVKGDYPEVPWSWDDNIITDHMRYCLKSEAAERLETLLERQRRSKELLNHPLFAKRTFELETYLSAGQFDRARKLFDEPHEIIKLELEAGNFEKVLELARNGRVSGYDTWIPMRAAIYTGNMAAYRRYLSISSPETKRQNRLPYLELLNAEPEAFKAWAKGEAAEYRGQIKDARQAYAGCVAAWPKTMAGAESAFRLAELDWLEEGLADYRIRFKKVDAAYAHMAKDESARAWALFRRGTIAYLVDEDSSRAAELWKEASKSDGYGKTYAVHALAGLSVKRPLVACGANKVTEWKKVNDIYLAEEFLALERDKDEPRATGVIVQPMSTESGLYEEEDADVKWYYYLWYLYAHHRPGITWLATSKGEVKDMTWCLQRSGTLPADKTRKKE